MFTPGGNHPGSHDSNTMPCGMQLGADVQAQQCGARFRRRDPPVKTLVPSFTTGSVWLSLMILCRSNDKGK